MNSNSNEFRKIPSKFETHLLEMNPHFRKKQDRRYSDPKARNG